MGFLSKIWKGVKKVVKKIGKGIKKVAMKVGKFMNKIGIVGQIALGLILPGIGSALGAWAGTASTNIFAAAAKGFVNAAIQVGTKVGSVFKTVTQGVTKVIGQTVGTVINKIPGAGDFIKDLTMGKLDITQMKNFTGKGGVFDTAGKVLTDTVAAGKDLFSMDTLTGKNKYYLEAMKSKVAEEIPTSGQFSKQGIDSLEALKPQMSSLDAGDTTKLFTDGRLVPADTGSFDIASGKGIADSAKIAADNAVGSTAASTTGVGPLKEGYSMLKKKAGNIIPDAIDKTASTLTDLPSNLIKKQAGLGFQTPEGAVSYSSNVGASQQFQMADTTITQPQMEQSGGGFLGFFGNPSLVYNAEQETANFMRNQQRGGF